MASKTLLENRLDRLRARVEALASDYDPAALQDSATTLADDIAALQSPYLQDEAAALSAASESVQSSAEEIRERVAEHSPHLTLALKKAMAAVRGADDDNLTLAENTVETLETALDEADAVLEPLLAPLTEAMAQARARVADIKRYQAARENASFDFAPDEGVVLADKAEWVQTGKGRQDPDGVLFLTTQRVVFEQKERKGGFMGIGGKKQHDLLFDLPLSAITAVAIDDQRAGLGVKDLLTLERADDEAITLEIKGGEDNALWQTWLQRALAGDLPTLDGDA